MKKHNLFKNLARFFLWSHVISVIGFYLVLWIRSTPSKNNRVKKTVSKPEKAEQPVTYPLVSIVVPARNEERNIRRCVESLLEQSYPNYEVIVVDDASTDDTPGILESILQTHPHSNRLWVQR
ncbi:MAG TPA: glycosyltransferase, partial [Ktedonobacteraceae bacterium]|nr:glycosyltransferase [Ktedonobacteraceae bacterium]